MENRQYDVAVVGAGIVGLAHAWTAARQGASVLLLERDAAARGASVRNFGMVWPIGQQAGAHYQMALTSRRLWLEFAANSGSWVQECGSIHLAHRPDEWAVLNQFASLADDLGYQCQLLSREQVLKKTPAANPQNLQGGLWSPTELCVNPRTAIARFPHWLSKQYDVAFEPNSLIREIEAGRLTSSDNRCWSADRIIVCGGSDFQNLFPESFARSGLQRCKLQMLATRPQPLEWRIGPHLASGLTLRHYASFSVCDSLRPLQERISTEAPELDRFGIHVMVSQNDRGQAILGDSHEYDRLDPFVRQEVSDLILRELRRVVRLQDWNLEEVWSGVYAKHPKQLYFEAEPLPDVKVVTGLGGAGMTLSFGLADHLWHSWGWSAPINEAVPAAVSGNGDGSSV